MRFKPLYLASLKMSIFKWRQKVLAWLSFNLPGAATFLPLCTYYPRANPARFSSLIPSDAFMVIDSKDDPQDLPKNFRLCQNLYDFRKVIYFHQQGFSLPVRTGMTELRCSGSGQFSLSSFLNIVPLMERPLVVFDLRHEPHFFNGGDAISFYTQGSNNFYHSTYSPTWAKVEQEILKMLKKETSFLLNIIIEKHQKFIYKAFREKMKRGELLTEKELLERHQVGYVRLPVLDSHLPDDQVVDQFLQALQHLPPESWIHFHCRGGKGRTSLFMTLYDIYKNAFQVDLDDIIKRHAFIGPSNVHEYPAIRRTNTLAFLKNFYNYVRHTKGLGHEMWSRWRQYRQPKDDPSFSETKQKM